MDDHGTARIGGPVMAVILRLWRPGFVAVVIACFIAAGSLMPVESARALPGGDFVRHAVSYGLLSIFAQLAVTGSKRSSIVLLGVFGFGAMLECVQPIFGRVADFNDLLANAAGIGAGLGVAIGIRGVLKYL